LASFALYFAASAGYFLCLWSTRRRNLWVALLVVLPVSLALGAVLFMGAKLSAPYESVLGPRLVNGTGGGWNLSSFWRFGTGLHCAASGLVLAIVYLLGLVRTKTQLPLRIAGTAEEEAASDNSWAGCKRLTYAVVAAARSVAVALPVGVLAKLASSLPVRSRYPSLTMSSLRMFSWALEIGIFLWAMGQQNKKYSFGLLRFKAPGILLLGIALPILVTFLLVLADYQVDRFHWATYEYGRFGPPYVENYFSLPGAREVLLIFAAFMEEVVFRGVLQKHFVQRYGVTRGIVLVGIVWAAFHFFGDHYPSSSDIGVALGLAYRVAQCVILGIVLSWLTLRSGSLWPAIFAHWLSNVGFHVMGASLRGWWRMLAWLLVALVLCKYWSAGEREIEEADIPAAEGSNR
jgi:membrane protease YdiL (CAAX protease family)